jgi:hypothetical protein
LNIRGNEEGLKEMRKYSSLNQAASIAVCFGILLSNSVYGFGDVRSAVPRDVELTTDGSLRGQVYTSEQLPVENAQIELKYQGTTIARTTTGPEGDFLITGVRGGAHEVSVGAINSPVRLWKFGTAPNGAVTGIVMAANENVIRGQSYDPYGDRGGFGQPSSGFGLMDVVALALVGAAATAVVIAIEDHKDDDTPPVVASP